MHKISYLRHNWLAHKLNNKALANHLRLLNGTVVDLGCGSQPYKSDILQNAEKYIGVDWGNSLHQSNVDLLADLNQALPLDSEVANCVLSLSVLEHLKEPQTMLNEAQRILKPGGTLFLQVPWQWRIHEAPHDYFRYTPYGLNHMLNKAGFTNVKVEPQSGFFTSWILKLNYFTVRWCRGPLALAVLLRAVLLPFWTLGQLLAPFLDKLDRDWSVEATGYTVLAYKAKTSERINGLKNID